MIVSTDTAADILPAEFELNWVHAQLSGNGGANQEVPVTAS